MSLGNFSNGGVDTFDPRNQYVGVRLQQGVPLLDRDWNELEDIRRHFERRLRELNIGSGVADEDGFAILAPDFAVDNDVMIGGGSCSVGGLDVSNDRNVLYSEQGDEQPLPAAAASGDTLLLYLEPDIVRIDATVEAALRNAQDINMETCLRDRLVWNVRAAVVPDVPPPGAYVLAEIDRPAGTTQIAQVMIKDRRRTSLNLASTVDRIAAAEQRLVALEGRMQAAQDSMESLRQSVNKLYWEVAVSASSLDPGGHPLFGSRATIAVAVFDRNGGAIPGALLDFATDWGSLNSVIASTDKDGTASVELIGIRPDLAVDLAHTGILERASQKVAAAQSAGAIEHTKVRFEPEELSLVSRYSPQSEMHDLSSDLPSGSVAAIPKQQTATVTVYARDAAGAVVRAVGSIQVSFGLWVRDWAQRKILDVTNQVTVAARIGDVMRQGFVPGSDRAQFDPSVVTDLLPHTLQEIHDATHSRLKEHLYDDPDMPDADLNGSGLLAQTIAEETTAAVGAGTNAAIKNQIGQFVDNASLGLGSQDGASAQTVIVQRSSQIAAGFAQAHKQTFSIARVGS